MTHPLLRRAQRLPQLYLSLQELVGARVTGGHGRLRSVHNYLRRAFGQRRVGYTCEGIRHLLLPLLELHHLQSELHVLADGRSDI